MKKWFKNNWNKLKSKISSKVSPKFYKILSVLISFPVATLMLHNVLSTKIVEIAEDLGIELDPEEMVHLLHVAEEMLHLFLEETKTKTKFDTLYESMLSDENKKMQLDESVKSEIIFESVEKNERTGYYAIAFKTGGNCYAPVLFSESVKKYEDEIVEFVKKLVEKGVDLK